MRTRRLGEGGPVVSVIGLGGNNFGLGASRLHVNLDQRQTTAVVRAALEAGVTLFDTADLYTGGDSETYLGRALGPNRADAVIVTKFGHIPAGAAKMPGAPDVPRGSRTYVQWAVDQSLRRLGTEWIDVYLHHHPDPSTPIATTVSAMSELVDAGKVRYIGCSNYSVQQIEEAQRACDEQGLAPIVALQTRYSLVTREAERALLPTCRELGVGLMAFFPLESGLLTGKIRRGEQPPSGSRLSTPVGTERDFLSERSRERAEELECYAQERELSLLTVALGGLLATPGLSCAITGATKPEQIRANALASEWVPSPEDYRSLVALG